MTQMPFPLPVKNPELLQFLKTRRSNMAKSMAGPGPEGAVLDDILSVAARVPDHRKLAPWRFVVFEGDARRRIGTHLGRIFKVRHPYMPDDRVQFEAERFLRAPVIVAVISSPVDCPRGTPLWEQQLSSAICCYNMCLAAQAYGFGAQWLTEWYAYDQEVLDHMGVEPSENIAGFIYMGTPQAPSLPRPRPDLDAKISRY